MRASPALQVVIDRFGVWRAAVIVLALAGLVVVLAWTVSPQASLPAASRWPAAVAALALLLFGSSAARVAPVSLRWDGQLWHLGPPASAGHEPESGQLHVVIDLGPWMLLRFEPTESTWRTHTTWLPVQKRGLEARWHALRCAVYSPRAQPGAGAATDS